MTIRQVPNTDLQYYLLAFTKDGVEQGDPDAGGGKLSEKALDALALGTTDVFILSHGWKGDLKAAVDQYDRWIGAMAQCTIDRQRARAKWPQFKPLLIGFHWPSQPFGDEKNDGSFAAESGGGEAAFIGAWADRIADTAAARAALKVIFDAAIDDAAPDRLPVAVVNAYRALEREAQLDASGVGGAPDADREPLDPQLSYQESQADEASFGGLFDTLLSPLRQLSFWTMKKRARTVGEGAGHTLLRRIRAASPTVRIHLMGHSFGCIVVSSILHGTDGVADVHVSSALLAQGAMSHWSFCDDIPEKRGTPGYFRKVITNKVIKGPTVVTTSRFDKAVGSWYPRAATPARQVEFGVSAALPKYGAIGTFGIAGSGLTLDTRVLSADPTIDYQFRAGTIYNVNCDGIVKTGGGASGAHSDIDHPELGHLFWEAVLASPDA